MFLSQEAPYFSIEIGAHLPRVFLVAALLLKAGQAQVCCQDEGDRFLKKCRQVVSQQTRFELLLIFAFKSILLFLH